MIGQQFELVLNHYRKHFPGEYSKEIHKTTEFDYLYVMGKFSFSEDLVPLCTMYNNGNIINIFLYDGPAIHYFADIQDIWPNIHPYWESTIRSHLDSDLRYHMFLQSANYK